MDLDAIQWDLIGKFAAGLGVALVAFWLYNRREKRRQKALEFSDVMRDWGLGWFAEAYRMYAVGDYSGIVHKIREVVTATRSDVAVLAKLDDVFWKVLAHYKDQPDKVAKIVKELAVEVTAKPNP